MKSKTEFVKRERQESEDSNQDDFQLSGDAQEYLNSILPNNSIKFKKHSQSVSIIQLLPLCSGSHSRMKRESEVRFECTTPADEFSWS